MNKNMKRKTLNARIFPNAGRSEVSEENGVLKVRVTAPAVRGKANKAALKLLADYLGVKKSALTIVKGKTSREKTIEVKSS